MKRKIHNRSIFYWWSQAFRPHYVFWCASYSEVVCDSTSLCFYLFVSLQSMSQVYHSRGIVWSRSKASPSYLSALSGAWPALWLGAEWLWDWRRFNSNPQCLSAALYPGHDSQGNGTRVKNYIASKVHHLMLLWQAR